MIQLLFSETNTQNIKKPSGIHWLDYLLCSAWIFFMIFLGVSMSGASSATSKYIDALAGVGRIGKAVNVQKVKKDFFKLIHGDVNVQAQGTAQAALQIIQINAETVLQIAIVSFVKALLSNVFNFLQNMLSKFKDSSNQIAKLFNISGPAKNLVKILNGRVNICQKVDNFVSGLFASNRANSPFELAYESLYDGRSLSSMLTSPGEFIAGASSSALSLVANVSVDAQVSDEIRQEAIRRDQEYLQQNLAQFNNNADGCELSLSNITGAEEDTDNPIPAIRNGINTLVGNCVSRQTSCVATKEENEILSRVATLSINSTASPSVDSEIDTTQPEVVTIFESTFGGPGNPAPSPDTPIQRSIIEADLRGSITESAEAARATQIPGADNPDNTAAVATAESLKGSDAGNVTVANPDGPNCGTARVQVGSTQSNTEDIPGGSVALAGLNGSIASACGVLVQGTSTDNDAGLLAEAAIQQSSATSTGGKNITDAVIGLVNEFIGQIFDLLIDTLFSFVNDIIGNFCASFAIDAVCDGLTQFSDTFRANLERRVSNIRINSSTYTESFEYISDGDRKILEVEVGGDTIEKEVPQLIEGREVNDIDIFRKSEFKSLAECEQISPNTPEGQTEKNRCLSIVTQYVADICSDKATVDGERKDIVYEKCLEANGFN